MRFNPFDEDWALAQLKEITSYFKSGKNIKSSAIKQYGTYPVYGGNGLRGFSSFYNNEDTCVLIGRQGALCGNVRLVCGKNYITEHAVIVRENNLSDIRFLLYLLSNMNLGQFSGQSAQPGLAVNRLLELPAYIPHINEQRKIADFLSLIDERIETQSKIIEETALLKKKISNDLFNGNILAQRPLESYYIKGKAGGTPISTKKEYYGGNIPFLSISDMTEQGKYLYKTEKTLSDEGLKNSSAWVVPKYSLILSMYASVGLVAINTIPISTSQAMFSMIIGDIETLEYLYYYLSFFKENKIHRFLETGTQSNINAEMVKTIPIPDFGSEQNKRIVHILKKYDEKIQIEKDILAAYKKQKAYLLSEMFI